MIILDKKMCPSLFVYKRFFSIGYML